MDKFDQDLLSIIQIGNKIANFYKDKPNDENVYRALLILLALESTLDRGRVLLDVDGLESLSQINKGMDNFRRDVVVLMEKLDAVEVKNALNAAGENLKVGFTN